MKVRVLVLGAGLVGLHYAVGIERIKSGELEPIGVPLAGYKMPVDISDIEMVGYVDVDESKVGKRLYDVAFEALGRELPIPDTLKEIEVYRGIHAGSLKGLPFKAAGLDDFYGMEEALNKFTELLDTLKPDVVINVITTEHAKPFNDTAAFIESAKLGRISASHAYALAVARYSEAGKKAAYVNFVPSPIANDPGVLKLYEDIGSLVFGDDGATGATPLTADLLEHLAERNRRVLSIAQFNIGGNTDFLALSDPSRNIMKERTKSDVVESILGYDVPHYIKPTGYLEPLGDKKFVAMHIWWKTFNGLEDELVVNLRINDSPALAGLMVDLSRIAGAMLSKGLKGTVYEVNAFFMKKPGPPGSKNIARILAYQRMISKLKELGIILQ
ncbi:MAG: myo-inositol-1-phosphate synthase [Desulfurococcales archaeon]|nr:myo-inositol-1-phosphate synthase [Desulfurococcales archaeon]